MSEPEIDHRCLVCGAAVRQSALFCPQCGNAIANKKGAPQSAPDGSPSSKSTPSAQALSDTIADVSPDKALTQPLTSFSPGVSQSVSARGHSNLQRATNVARSLEENVLGGVGKLRKVSSVVIDQAAYDPSLRFILVAAVLFVLSLLLLILSKVIN
jgi:hypothetical protein